MRRCESGFTLIELMVAMAVLGVVTAQLLFVLNIQKRVYVSNDRLLDVQQDARLVTDLILTEARVAGFMVPRRVGISSRDGGTGAADVLCVSDPTVMNAATVEGAAQRFPGGDVLDFTAADRVRLAGLSDLDVDGAGAAIDFSASRGVIIADPNSSHCASIDSITVGVNPVVDFDPPLTIGDYNTALTRVVPAIVYQIGGAGLTRNAMQLSPEVEDLQVEFGVDVDGDGIVSNDPNDGEFPVDDLTGFDTERVRTVRLTVVTRTLQNDAEYAGPGLPGSANRNAGATDGFRRRRFVTTFAPRNMR